MADRLAELLRQRALLQEHAAWLDREIAEASGQTQGHSIESTPSPRPLVAAIAAVVAAPAPRFVVPATVPAPVPASPTAEVSVVGEDILEQYRVAPQALQTDVRKGCLLYFVAAFLFLFVVIGGLYLAFRK